MFNGLFHLQNNNYDDTGNTKLINNWIGLDRSIDIGGTHDIVLSLRSSLEQALNL